MRNKMSKYLAILFAGFFYTACKVPALVEMPSSKPIPGSYLSSSDTTNIARLKWRTFFKDPNLLQLIDTALLHNQELLITLQEIEMARNDIRVRKGMLFPMVTAKAGLGMDKVGRYTSQGAGDASTEITSGKIVPEILSDQVGIATAHWEADIWKKLRNAKQAAIQRFLATEEGKNFVITNLVSEISKSYFELIGLDNQLDIVRQSIQLQKDALEIVKVQKEASRVTELAVRKFEAEVLNSQSKEFEILQKIVETENEINFLLGRFPTPIPREKNAFLQLTPPQVFTGIPAQLLKNRADIKKAELELAAAKLDVRVARAEFFPSLDISASLGLNAFSPKYIARLPESLIFSLAGDLTGPLINKNAIKAEYLNANARQIQALYNYDRTILTAFMEVYSQMTNISNLEKIYTLKSKEVDALNKSIDISSDLFKSARADYLEVLMTQRDALTTRLELIETKLSQLQSVTNIYRAVGGGWN